MVSGLWSFLHEDGRYRNTIGYQGEEEAADVGAAVAVERAEAGGATAAAAAWHAEPVVRFLCSTFGDRIAGVRMNEDGLVVLTAELPGDGLVEVSVAVGPEGTCACRISAGDTHLASTARDARSFERVPRSRLAEVGVQAEDDAGSG